MKFEIKNRWSGEVLFSLETESFKLCVITAIKSRANLTDANLSRADLTCADLTGANLSRANLSRANLTGADLSRANLTGADLSRANLSRANLTGADLTCADLTCADLTGANLTCADLTCADLTGANLTDANLTGANLTGANLTGAKNSEIILARTSIVPEEGAFVGYKKLANGVVAKLVIPHDAKRLNAYGSRKCRAEKVFVLEGEGYDKHTGKTKYTPDTWVIPDSFNEDRREECSHGIHFFITRAEAKNY